jgi:hypothetical protein
MTSTYIIHRRITLRAQHVPTGKTRHTQGSVTPEGVISGIDLQTPSELMIAQIPPDYGYYLLYLDNQGNEITDTYHDTLEQALEQAKWEFQVEPIEWETVL